MNRLLLRSLASTTLALTLALGAAGAQPQPERFHTGIDTVVLAMDAYTFHPGTGAPA